MPETRRAVALGFAKLERLVLLIGLLLLVAVLAVGWYGDHRSCTRSVPLRQYVIDQVAIDTAAEHYWRELGDYATADRIRRRLATERRVHQIGCWRFLPGA